MKKPLYKNLPNNLIHRFSKIKHSNKGKQIRRLINKQELIHKLRLIKYSKKARKQGIEITLAKQEKYEFDFKKNQRTKNTETVYILSKDKTKITVGSSQLRMVLNMFDTLSEIAVDNHIDLSDDFYITCKLWGFEIKTDLQSIRTIDTEIKPYLKYYNLHSKYKGVALDMGAYHGIFSFYAIGRNPTLTVYAFEPDPDSYQVLCENIARNNITNIIPINKANWLTNTTLKLRQNRRGSQISEEGVDIQTINISSFVHDYNIDKIDFVKMDIEGAEIEVTKDMLANGFIKNTSYAIASYHIVNHEETKYELEQMFLAKGIVTISEGKHLTTYTIGEAKRVLL